MTKIPLLDPKNFTPQTRTPWAGKRLAQSLKKNFAQNHQAIGESWEFSCGPDFPSSIVGSSVTIDEYIANDPQKVLGRFQYDKTGGQCEILVKLIHADSPLSLQIHPTDVDPDLKAKECGKPESWYVVEADPGCGIYLGFSEPLSIQELRKRLSGDAEAMKKTLQFVPVQAGDYFEIAPGVPHAIGPGVVLLEPQRIRPGYSGKTYRMWDWGRTYDANGIESSEGKPRELHVDAALKLVDPRNQVGMNYVHSLKTTPSFTELSTSARLKSFPSNDYYQTHILDIDRNGSLCFEIKNGFGILVNLSNDVQLETFGQTIPRGQTAFIPATDAKLDLKSGDSTQLALITPAGSQVQGC